MNRDKLVAAAKEMNEVMNLEDPEIDLRLVTSKLEKQIRVAGELISKKDKFSKETTAVLTELGILPLGKKKKAKDEEEEDKPKKKSKPVEEDDDEEEDDEEDEDEEEDDEEDEDEEEDDEEEDDEDDEDEEEDDEEEDDEEDEDEEEDDEEEDDEDEEEDDEDEDDEEEDLVTTVNKTAKLADLKAIVEEHTELKKLRKSLDEYQGLQGPKQLKLAIYKVLGVEPPKPAPRKTGTGRKRGKGGQQLADELLAAGASKKEIYKAFIKLYNERGQEDEDFIKGRADIYMKLAANRAKSSAPAKEEKSSKKKKKTKKSK